MVTILDSTKLEYRYTQQSSRERHGHYHKICLPIPVGNGRATLHPVPAQVLYVLRYFAPETYPSSPTDTAADIYLGSIAMLKSLVTDTCYFQETAPYFLIQKYYLFSFESFPLSNQQRPAPQEPSGGRSVNSRKRLHKTPAPCSGRSQERATSQFGIFSLGSVCHPGLFWESICLSSAECWGASVYIHGGCIIRQSKRAGKASENPRKPLP
jgi:hypothetical protein